MFSARTRLTPEVATITASLLKNPAEPSSARDWATRTGFSVQTLNRRFRKEVGTTFRGWRTACKLAAASEYLLAGYRVEWIAHRVGYSHASGLISAFRNHYGTSPEEWARQQTPPNSPSDRVRRLQQTETLVNALAGNHTTSAPPVPGTVIETSTTQEGYGVLYLYSGTARRTIDGRNGSQEIHLTTGDALWSPSGLEGSFTADPGSVLCFHCGFPDTSTLYPLPDSSVVKIPPAQRDLMVYHSIANRTLIHPSNYNRLEILEIFEDAASRQHRMAVNLPSDPSARVVAVALTRNLRDDRTLQQWADDTGGDPQTINLGFIEDTGKTFRSLAGDPAAQGGPRPHGRRHITVRGRQKTRRLQAPERVQSRFLPALRHDTTGVRRDVR